VTNPTTGEAAIISTNITDIDIALEELKSAILACNRNEVKTQLASIEKNLQKIEEVLYDKNKKPKYSEIKSIINISKEVFKVRITDILLDMIFLKNHNYEEPEPQRVKQWAELVA